VSGKLIGAFEDLRTLGAGMEQGLAAMGFQVLDQMPLALEAPVAALVPTWDSSLEEVDSLDMLFKIWLCFEARIAIILQAVKGPSLQLKTHKT
jgi:hypothetical protein